MLRLASIKNTLAYFTSTSVTMQKNIISPTPENQLKTRAIIVVAVAVCVADVVVAVAVGVADVVATAAK